MYITDALSLSIVPRWAIVPTIRRQSVAEHSFNVAIIVQELLCRFPHLCSGPTGPALRPYQLMFHALNHDLDECITGDIPRFAKKSIIRAKRDIPDLIPDLPPVGLTISEIELVKLADIMEAATWIRLNGHGDHAMGVAARLQLDLWAYLDTHNIQEMFKDTMEIRRLYADIVSEKGREAATGSRA